MENPRYQKLARNTSISTAIKKQAEKQEIGSTLYDPRIYIDNERFMQKVKKF